MKSLYLGFTCVAGRCFRPTREMAIHFSTCGCRSDKLLNREKLLIIFSSFVSVLMRVAKTYSEPLACMHQRGLEYLSCVSVLCMCLC